MYNIKWDHINDLFFSLSILNNIVFFLNIFTFFDKIDIIILNIIFFEYNYKKYLFTNDKGVWNGIFSIFSSNSICSCFYFYKYKNKWSQRKSKTTNFKKYGISSSDINASINSGFEKKQLENFLAEHINYTEDSIKEILRQYATQIFNRISINEFSQEVCEKMEKDSKLDKMKTMQYVRTNILKYGNSKLNTCVVFSDTKDEYIIYLFCNIIQEKIQVENYRISKGAMLGF